MECIGEALENRKMPQDKEGGRPTFIEDKVRSQDIRKKETLSQRIEKCR